MKTIVISIALLLLTSSYADARKRQRITVRPPIASQRPIVQHPYAVELVLSYIFCGFHVFSVGPEPKPGQLGECATWFNYSQPKRTRRA